MAIDRDFNIQYLNPAGEKLMGLAKGGALGRKCYDLMKTPHCRTAKCALYQTMKTGKAHLAETVVDPENINLPIEYMGSPLTNEQGEIVGATEFIRDISARKRIFAEIVEFSHKLAEGNLVSPLSTDYQGDFAILSENLNAAINHQRETLQKIAATAQEVSHASGAVADAAHSSAEGASEQASSLQEASSNLERLAQTTKDTVHRTQLASNIAVDTQSGAQDGRQAMKTMMSSMEQIRQAAADTAQIIRDINEIAFQTNLLALNAAVEAARAGDAGRGFAVVAEEVRALAQRSKEAARKTENLINTSLSLAEHGKERTSQVNGSLDAITASIEKVTGLIEEIRVASEEQSKSIDHINKSVAQIDQVTQQSVANAEQSSSAAAELNGQAEEMVSLVGSFQLEGGGAPPLPRPVVPSSRFDDEFDDIDLTDF